MTETLHRKRACPSADWTITFDDPSSLRCIVESSAAVMQRVIFKVKKIGASYFLMVDGNDPGFTCCISARLQLHRVEFADPHADISEFTFCVDSKQILYSIDNPSCSHGSLVMEGHTSDATIHLRMRDPDQLSHEDFSRLSTFVDGDTQSPTVDNITFNMILEIDLTKLKEMVKKARKAHAEHLRISVFTKRNGSKEQSLVIFSVKGDSEHQQKFCNEMTRDEDGSVIVRAVVDGNEELFDTQDSAVFEGIFPIEKIDAFVKNLQVRMLVAKVENNMPLMLTHNLAPEGDDSHVRFLVAPKTEDD